MIDFISPFSVDFVPSSPPPSPPNPTAQSGIANLSNAEADSITRYTGIAYGPINSALRESPAASHEMRESVLHMDSGIKKLAADNSDVQKSFRGATKLPRNVTEGGTYLDRAYLSTSRGDTPQSRSDVRSFATDGTTAVVFGKSGADLSRHGVGWFEEEREVLYPRRTPFKVLLHTPMTDGARAKIKPDSALSPNTQSLMVLEERGLPPADPNRARLQQSQADISPGVAPIGSDRLHAAYAAMSADPARLRAHKAEVDLSPAATPERLQAAQSAVDSNHSLLRASQSAAKRPRPSPPARLRPH